jgi:peptidylprolyl isomerase
MKMKLANVFALLAIVGTAAAFSISMTLSSSGTGSKEVDRRTFVGSAVAGAMLAGTTGLAAPALAAADADADPYADFTTTESGMKYKVTKEGQENGAIPQAGQTVKAHYTGWLEGFDSDKKFDSSRDRNRPFSFSVGAGQVIRGWDESFSSMKVGERRQIILPPRLGYGDRGAGGIIPGGATLYFDVELLAIQ